MREKLARLKAEQPEKTPPTAPPTEEELGEFFGEAKKSSTRQFVAEEREEEGEGAWAGELLSVHMYRYNRSENFHREIFIVNKFSLVPYNDEN